LEVCWPSSNHEANNIDASVQIAEQNLKFWLDLLVKKNRSTRDPMSLTGKIQNGVVVLPPGTMLPEGAEVKVETITAEDTFNSLVEKLAKPRHHLPQDYALNHGHYNAGEPKK
jgi:hypothetical protein